MSTHRRVDKQGPGAKGFTRQYWDDNYAAPFTMDGVFNAREHAVYTKALLDSEFIEVGSLIELGFGLGYLFKEMMAVFMPHTAVGIEPSPQAFHRAQALDLAPSSSTDLSLHRLDIESWCQQPAPEEPFDLAICSSVFQYLSDPEAERILPVLAARCRYLYFSVPTDEELDEQARTLGLDDTYAIGRTQQEYLTMLRPHFTIISRRVLESKVHYTRETSDFNDYLFRF